MEVKVELPAEVTGGRRASEWAKQLRMYAVLDAWRDGEISTGRAASLLGVTRPAFLFVAARYVPTVNYSPDEVDEELAVLDRVL